MPVASPDQYLEMLDRAKKGGFAYPAINVSSSQTLNAALAGLAEAGSDGIIQVTTGGGDYWSGPTIKKMASGAAAMAAFAREAAKNYGITIALHTDHCAKHQPDDFVRPLIAISQDRVKAGQDPLFNSPMWDGSAVPMGENLTIAKEMLALTFGNVHGVYKPGNVKLRPELLGDIQAAVGAKYGKDKPFDLVFHGGSGSTPEEIALAVSHGVIKMNIDTDLQYAFTRPIAGHMLANYDGVLKVDGEVGNKKHYDPRAWGKLGEAGMAARVVEAAKELGSAGKSQG